MFRNVTVNLKEVYYLNKNDKVTKLKVFNKLVESKFYSNYSA